MFFRYLLICSFILAAGFEGISQDTVPEPPLPDPQTSLVLWEDFIKQQDGDIGLKLNINGLISNISVNAPLNLNNNHFLLLNYNFKDDMLVRMGVGLKTENNLVATVDSMPSAITGVMAEVTRDSSFTRSSFFVAPGIEKHFLSTKRLDPYAGISMDLGIIGRKRIQVKEVAIDTNGTSVMEFERQESGGTSIGLNIVLGFNYFFAKKLAIGAEVAWGYLYSAVGGDWNEVTITEPAKGIKEIERNVGSNRNITAGLQTTSTGNITLSYYFSPK